MFSQGLKELQNWVTDTSHMLQTYCTPTADKNVLDSRMIKLEVRGKSSEEHHNHSCVTIFISTEKPIMMCHLLGSAPNKNVFLHLEQKD